MGPPFEGWPLQGVGERQTRVSVTRGTTNSDGNRCRLRPGTHHPRHPEGHEDAAAEEEEPGQPGTALRLASGLKLHTNPEGFGPLAEKEDGEHPRGDAVAADEEQTTEEQEERPGVRPRSWPDEEFGARGVISARGSHGRPQ